MENSLYKHIIYDAGYVMKFDKDGVITFVNDNYCQISGYTKDEIIGQKYDFWKANDNSNNYIYSDIFTKLSNSKKVQTIFKNISKDGKIFFMDSSIYPSVDTNTQEKEFVSFSTNLTKYMELITYDPLTKLKNFQTLKNDIDPSKQYLAIIINIDNLSEIGEFYGDTIADMLKQAIAKRLKIVFKGSQIYKLQGDEFAIFKQLPAKFSKEELENMTKYKLKSAFDNNFMIEDIDITLTITAGLSISNQNHIRNAHLALKNARSKNLLYSVYDDTLLEKFANFTINKEVATRIKTAIKQNKIIPYYQPIVDNKTKKIIKYEALARLIKDDDVMPPGTFIDISKKIKYYHKITRAILKQSFNHFGINSEIGVSINITIEDIANIRTFNLIIDLLNQNKFNHNITFELVESDGIEDDQLFNRFVDTIKSYGAKISIDDFGTGYSNFSYLAKLEPDYLKIDGSLIKNIKNTKEFDVVKTIIDFARMYGIKTIAEFVENEEIFILVKELGIDYSQGYYFGKPVSIDMV